jgi:ATP:ADP antiporter, AAA family
VAIVAASLVCAVAAAAVASRLSRGYVQTLERNLRDRAADLDLSEADDLTTRTIVLQTLAGVHRGAPLSERTTQPVSLAKPAAQSATTGIDPEIQDIMSLRSRNRERILEVLRRDKELTPPLVPHVIPLLAWDPVAEDAIRALSVVAPSHVGTLSDALLDPYEEFAVRRRIPRVMSVCRTQRAADSLLLGLADTRFEVRVQCGRALTAIVAKQPAIHIDHARIFDVVLREVAVGRPVWESRRLLDRLDDDESGGFVDEFVRGRANQSLAHVFTTLSLVLPAAPLQIALRGLHADDPNLRGTALEYLETILPPVIRDPLWPFLEDHRPAGRTVRPREDVLADLVRSNHSIMLNLEELKRRAEAQRGSS